MQFSAYQIESMLDEFQQVHFPTDKSVSETLSLSEEAINEARQYFRTPEDQTSAGVSPKDIMGLIEDQNDYDPIVDYVQQSRAGRFVEPVYVPENVPPSFSLVTDHTPAVRKDSYDEQETPESESAEKDHSDAGLDSKTEGAEDKVSVNEIEAEIDETQSEKIEISTAEKVSEAKSADQQDAGLTKEADKESVSEITEQDSKKSKISKHKKPADSAAKLFESIDDDELDEEFEFDDRGLHSDGDEDNDVVFGDGPIDPKSMSRFVQNFPDSAIKFMFRKNLDGRHLPAGYEEIYIKWEKRGLSRGRLKKYLFKLMEWDKFPDIPVRDVVKKIRDRQYDLKDKK